MGSGNPIAACAARLLTAASSPRRDRSRVAPLAAAMLPTGLVEEALMLANAVSSSRSEGDAGSRDELLCFVFSQYPSPVGRPDVSPSPPSLPSAILSYIRIRKLTARYEITKLLGMVGA